MALYCRKKKDAADLENFKKQYQIDTLTDEIDQGRIPQILEFYFGGPNDSFFTKVLNIDPDEDTMFFMQFLATNHGSQIMKQNRLSIHSSTGDLYYDGINTNESLFDFYDSQKTFTKKRIKEKLCYGGTFEQYLSHFLPVFDADTDARLDTLTNKSIKYLFYRYNDYLVSKGFEPSPIIHTKLSTDKVVKENLQNRDWQCLVKSLIYKVEKDKDYYKIKTTEDSKMIQDMVKNYRVLRRIHHNIYTTIVENFKYYLSSITQSEFDEIESDIISSSLNSLQNVETATELLMLIDFFYFVKRRFPTTVTHTFVLCADLPMEVNGEELNIKKLYEKFRTTNSHALVSSQFLAALNIFFGGDPELSRRFLTEFYQNMTVSASINLS